MDKFDQNIKFCQRILNLDEVDGWSVHDENGAIVWMNGDSIIYATPHFEGWGTLTIQYEINVNDPDTFKTKCFSLKNWFSLEEYEEVIKSFILNLKIHN